MVIPFGPHATLRSGDNLSGERNTIAAGFRPAQERAAVEQVVASVTVAAPRATRGQLILQGRARALARPALYCGKPLTPRSEVKVA